MRIILLAALLLITACADPNTMTPEDRADRTWAIRNASIGLQNMGSQIYAQSQPRQPTWTNCFRTMAGYQCSSY
jgi:hypothetical protein